MICLTLAPVLAGLVDILETPVEGADAATAAGLSGIRDTGGSLIAFRTAASHFSVRGRGVDRGRVAIPAKDDPAGFQSPSSGFQSRRRQIFEILTRGCPSVLAPRFAETHPA